MLEKNQEYCIRAIKMSEREIEAKQECVEKAMSNTSDTSLFARRRCGRISVGEMQSDSERLGQRARLVGLQATSRLSY